MDDGALAAVEVFTPVTLAYRVAVFDLRPGSYVRITGVQRPDGVVVVTILEQQPNTVVSSAMNPSG